MTKEQIETLKKWREWCIEWFKNKNIFIPEIIWKNIQNSDLSIYFYEIHKTAQNNGWNKLMHYENITESYVRQILNHIDTLLES